MFPDQESFDAAARAIAEANNLTIETASDYLVLIGDTPELDENGLTIVRDTEGNELARITLPADAS
jgi:bifunctional N-acetylglucosamine-1-phosphate-uridyltransferase/glucosamine-1-phosphate-acetyltransferase GlmU-like protein